MKIHQGGLTHRAQNYPPQRFGGAQQAVAIARALVLPDKPTGRRYTRRAHGAVLRPFAVARRSEVLPSIELDLHLYDFAMRLSVSMTINGPAPTILAMFLNTAIDQQRKMFEEENGREPNHAERGGVLGAMETGYQRGKIQDESLHYEHKKHDGSLPIVGVNTYLKEDSQDLGPVELARSTEEEKQSQLKRLREFQAKDPEDSKQALERVRQAAMNNDNVFAELMHAVRYCSLGQITQAMFEVGGQYRRTM